jgi:uncharacterized protein involved in exopolysaccharide biosynthesis
MRTLDQRERLFDTPTTGAPPPPASASATVLRNPRLDKLKLDLAQLEGFPDKHPDVRRIKDEIATLEAELAAATPATPASGGDAPARVEPPSTNRSRTIAALDGELEKLKADEATLRQAIAGVERKLEGVPYRENEFAALSRDHRAMREQYESLLKRYEEAQLGQSMEAENQGERFRILESAVPPTGPVAPNRVRLVIMGLFLAVLAASMAVLIAEQFDTTFHSVEDLRQFTRIPVLAAIPRMKTSRPRRALRLAAVTASLLVVFALIGTLSAHLAQGNESLVRLLVRG